MFKCICDGVEGMGRLAGQPRPRLATHIYWHCVGVIWHHRSTQGSRSTCEEGAELRCGHSKEGRHSFGDAPVLGQGRTEVACFLGLGEGRG